MRQLSALWVLALILGLGACKADQGIGRVTTTDIFLQEPTNKVDILWVVDNSRSMEGEQAEVASKFAAFIGNVEASNADFHIGVVTTDMTDPDQRGKLQGDPLYLTSSDDYIPLFQERVLVGTAGSDQEKGIDAAWTALSEPLVSGFNGGFRRNDATLSVIYLSDENDCTDHGTLASYTDALACYDHSDQLVDVKDLITDYKQLQTAVGRMIVSAVVGPTVDKGCDGTVPGFRYIAMAQAFGGLQASICEADFSRIMEDLSLEVSGVQTSYQLTHAAVEESISVDVDGTAVDPGPDNGWTYDSQYWIVYFHGDGIPARGATISITYEIASGAAAPDTGAPGNAAQAGG